MNTADFKGTTVLITGASSGIGAAFAHYLASLGANLILTARSEGNLNQIADDLKKKYAILVHIFPADLSDTDAPQQIFDQVKAAGLTVDALINNAGFGKWAHFLAVDIETYQRYVICEHKCVGSLNLPVHPKHAYTRQGRCNQCGVNGCFSACSLHSCLQCIQIVCPQFYRGTLGRI